MVKLSKLIETLDWSEVKASLIGWSPFAKKYINGYQHVFIELQKLISIRSEMRIVVYEAFWEEVDEEPNVEVVGRNGALNRDQKDFQYMEEHAESEYANAETNFSLSFKPWEEWLGMEVDPCSFENYTKSQIVAYCIRDMAFYGFEQSQIQAEKDELQKSFDEWHAMTDEEREKNSVSMEDMRKKIEEWKKEYNEE